jgi:tungstate transport system substrate-binding protein
VEVGVQEVVGSLVLISILFGCKGRERLKIATTTSVEATGIIEEIIKPFKKKHKIEIDIIGVGTGKALKLGENRNVELVIVHAPKKELEFMEKGFGRERYEFMFNNFVIVGPKEDPAQILNCNSAVIAFKKIKESNSLFLSRGDSSGTHLKELELWEKVGGKPREKVYKETGQGMGLTLKIADELNAYTLVDEGTFLAYQKKVGLKILVKDKKNLLNIYSVMLITNHPLGEKFFSYMKTSCVAEIINDYKVNNTQLFFSLNEKN